jgi:hypothetical protein
MFTRGLLTVLAAVSIAMPVLAGQPIADARGHEFLTKYVEVGRAVLLDGSASYGRGCELSYAWTLVSRPDGSGAEIGGATRATTSFVPDREGDYVIDLVVADSGGTSEPARIAVSAMQCKTGLLVPIPCQYPLPAKNADRWMLLTPSLMDKTLRDITLPGTHDSGAYWLNTDERGPDFIDWSYDLGIFGDFSWDSLENEVGYDLTRTQTQTLLEQLNDGIRYFDLRVTHRGSSFYTYHGLLGRPLVELLADIRAFMEQSERELVVVNASHMATGTSTSNDEPFEPARHHELMQLVVDQLRPYLYPRNAATTDDLLAVSLGEILAGGPRVLMMYDDDYFASADVQNDPNSALFWPAEYASGGGYTDTVKMFDSLSCPRNAPAGDRGQFNDQRCRAQQYLDGDSQLGFTLFQTLTANQDVGTRNAICRVSLGLVCDSPRTLHQLTQTVNPYLPLMLEAILPLRPNVVLADRYQESAVVSEAIRLSQADLAPPATTATLDPPPNDHNCNTTNVTAQFTSRDKEAGSGVKEIHYWMTGTSAPDTVVTCGAEVDVPVTAKGVTTLHYYGVDRAGNAEEQRTLEVSISPGGDLTGDCKVDRGDLDALMHAIVRKDVPPSADADSDGAFTAVDFRYILCRSGANCPH